MVGAGGGGGAVAVQGEFPAPAVDGGEVVEAHRGTRLGRLVGPPRDRGVMWWMSQAEAGWSQPGKAQYGWRVVTARRRWAGMVSVAAPMSSGRLTVVSGCRPGRRAAGRRARRGRRGCRRRGRAGRGAAGRGWRVRAGRWAGGADAGAGRGAGRPVPPGRQAGRGQARGPGRRCRMAGAARAGTAGWPGPGLARLARATAAGSAGAVRAGGLRGMAADAAAQQEGLGELVQGGPVHVPGHHRHHRRITQGGVGLRAGQPARLGRPRGRPGILGRRTARGAPQLGQAQVHQHLRRLPGPRRDHPGPDQPPARLLQRVMTALPGSPGILRPGLLPQRLQHRR